MKIVWPILLIIVIVTAGAAGYFYFQTKKISEMKISPTPIDNTPNSKEQAEIPIVPKEIKILFVGDTMLARSVGTNLLKGIDPFENLEPTFKNYDLVVANLETTVSDKGTAIIGKAFTLRAPPEAIDYLNKAEIKVVSLANNHIKDFGKEGLTDTINRLSAAGITYFGAGNNSDEAFAGKVVTVGDVKIGLIGINEIENGWTISKSGPTSAWIDMTRVKAEIIKLKPLCDIVVIMPHWGTEYHTVENAHQKLLGHQMIEAGADLVIGTHPHVIQGNEEYMGKMIYYSLGNFVFDQMTGIPNATTGKIVEIDIMDKKISGSRDFEVSLGKDGRPTLKP